MRVKWAAGVMVSLLMLVACGDDSPAARPSQAASPSGPVASATPGPDPSLAEVCEAAETIARLDDESQGLLNDVLAAVSAQKDPAAAKREFERGMPRIKKLLVEKTPEMVAAYDQLKVGIPPELKDDVATVSDFTVRLAKVMSRMDALEDFSRLEPRLAKMGAIEAGTATLAVDKFTRDECGVTLAD